MQRKAGAPKLTSGGEMNWGAHLEKLATGILGLDTILGGGLPRGSLALIGGPPGVGKTVLTTQIAFHHASQGKRVLMLTALTEANAKLIAFLDGFEYFDTELIGNGLEILNIQMMLAEEGLEPLLAEIRTNVLANHIEILVIDSLRSLNTLVPDTAQVQSFIFGLGAAMFLIGCTTLLVEDQYAPSEREPPEQGIADTILSLQLPRVGQRTMRQIEVVKARGLNPLMGRHSFEICNSGIQVYPRIESRVPDGQVEARQDRLSWGVSGLDELTGGGIPSHSSTLVTGTAGIGKTTLSLQFVAAGARNQEACLYVPSFESQTQLLSKARGFGLELDAAVDIGTLRIMETPTGGIDCNQLIHHILEDITQRSVKRLVLDTIHPLERELLRDNRFTEALGTLARFLRSHGVASLYTRELTQIVGQELDITNGKDAQWSTIDNMVLMRPIELSGSLGRVLSILKMRASDHSKKFHQLDITPGGITIVGEIEGLQGILSGLPRRV